MSVFSIPYNNDRALLYELFHRFPDTSGSCGEIYFAAPNRLMGTGRVINQDESYEKEIVELVSEARKYRVLSNILLNSGCLGLKMADSEFMKEAVHYLYAIKEAANPDMVTLSDFLLAKEVKKQIPDLKLECSSIAYVDSLEKAKYWEEIGCDMMVIPPVMNKNMRFIEQLRRNLSGIRLKAVVNQECLCSCPMWHSHHNLRGHGNEGEMYWDACKKYWMEKPWAFYASSYIPPGCLHFYDPYIHIYKLVDRRHTTEMILENFGVYSGDVPYRDKAGKCNERIPEKVFKKVTACSRNCEACGYCKNHWIRWS